MKLKISTNVKIDNIEIKKRMRRIVWLSANKLFELAVSKAPVDTGRLRNSITLSPLYPDRDKYVLSVGVLYGVYVEYGTRPHPVSYKYLEGWARRKLGDSSAAYTIARSIALHGTRPHPFFRPALDEVKKIWVKRYAQTVFKPDLRKV